MRVPWTFRVRRTPNVQVSRRGRMTAPTVIGNVNVDLIVHATKLPPPGHERIVDEVACRVGGAAANAALTMSALGSRPRLIGSVGDDHFGSFIMDALAERGLDGDVRVTTGEPTGVSIAFEDDGRDRSFLIGLGSLATFDVAAIPPDAVSGGHVLLCGYFTLPALRGRPTIELLAACRSSGGTTFFDPGWDPDGWTETTKDELRSILPTVDVFLPNELEVTSIAGTTVVEDAARALQALSGGWLVVKRGAAGCLAVGPEDRVFRVRADPVTVVDTTGAGDAFNGALIVAISEGQPIDDALRFASKVASTVVSRPSSGRYPARDDLVR